MRTRIGRGTASTVAALTVTAALAAPAGSQPGGAAKWVHHDGDTFIAAAALVRANGDEAPDVVLASSDRLFYWVWLLPPGHPMALINQTHDEFTAPERKLTVLDGSDGTVLWEETWAPPQVGSPQEVYEVVEDLDTGDFDGDGRQEIVVSRTSYDAAGRRPPVHRLTSYDPATGRIDWERRRSLDPSVIAYALDFEPVTVGGRRLALIVDEMLGGRPKVRARFSLSRLTAGEPPRTVARVSTIEGTASWTARREDSALWIFRAKRVPRGSGEQLTMVPIGVDAIKVRPEREDIVSTTEWTAESPTSAPLVYLDGKNPLIVGRSGDDFLARDAGTGSLAWSAPSSEYGATAAPLSTGPGADENLAWSPVIGGDTFPVPASLLASGGSAAEIAALGHKTGEELWTHREPLGKFGALRLEAVDVVPGAGSELLGIMSHQDGFTHTSTSYDDHGLVTIQDTDTATTLCRFSTARVASAVLPANIDGEGAPEIVVATYGGTTYAFPMAQPWCGHAADLP